MRRANLRFLITFACVATVLIVGAHLVHGFQTRRVSSILLLKARESTQQNQLGEAASYYERYISIVPDDTAALGEYGLTLAQIPWASSKSIAVLDQVLRRDPKFPNARRTLARVAVACGRYTDAKAHLDTQLLKEFPEDGELRELRGICQLAERDYKSAAESFQAATNKNPQLLSAYDRWERLLQHPESQQLKEANPDNDALNPQPVPIEQMVANNPKSAQAHFLHGCYSRDYGGRDTAIKDAEKAIELDDQKIEYFLFAA